MSRLTAKLIDRGAFIAKPPFILLPAQKPFYVLIKSRKRVYAREKDGDALSNIGFFSGGSVSFFLFFLYSVVIGRLKSLGNVVIICSFFFTSFGKLKLLYMSKI